MNELIIQLCERLKVEADAIINCMKSGAVAIRSGHEDSINTATLFDGFAVDSVDHCQKIVVALSKCFYQQAEQTEEGKK